MRLTAVEWFYDQITRTYWDYMTTERQNELFERAKEMERGHAQLYSIYCLTSIKENLPVIRFEDFIKLEGGEK